MRSAMFSRENKNINFNQIWKRQPNKIHKKIHAENHNRADDSIAEQIKAIIIISSHFYI